MIKGAKARTATAAMLGQAMSLYLHTDAGHEASQLAGPATTSTAKPRPAPACCFEQLLALDGAEQGPRPRPCSRPPTPSTTPATGQRKDLVCEELKSRGTGSWSWARRPEDRGRPAGRHRQDGRSASTANDASDSPIYRGTPGPDQPAARRHRPSSRPRWKQPMVYLDSTGPTAKRIQQRRAPMKTRRQPILSAYFPVTATVTKGDKTLPLLLFKNYWGIQAVNMKTGKLEWNSPSNWSLESMLAPRGEARKAQAINNWLRPSTSIRTSGRRSSSRTPPSALSAPTASSSTPSRTSPCRRRRTSWPSAPASCPECPGRGVFPRI